MLAIRFRRIAVLCITFAVSLIAGVQTRTHPYLFFSSSDTATIRNRANSAGPANQFWNLILADEANRYMASPYGGELLANFNCHENIYSLALAYVLTGNSAYVDRLKVLMWQGENSQLWGNQKGLLDPARGVDDYNYWLGAKKIIGECLVYDLLSNDENLTLQQKQDIKNAILSDLKNQHGPYAPLRQSVLNTYSNHYFSNWLAVTGAALGIAAMTLYDDPDYPEAASDLQTAKERVITAEDSFLKRYFPEGANFEGVTYSFLALDRVLIMMYMLSRFDGVDYFNQADIASVISKIPEWWAYEVLPKRANPLPTDPLYRCFNDISDMYYRGLGWESGQLTGLLIVGAKYNKPLCKWIFDNTIQTIPRGCPKFS